LEISLEETLQKGEGQSIEFKAGVIDSNVAKVIAAFANTNAGNIFIGVEDNGGISGLREQTAQERDQLLRKIRQVTTMIQPPVSPGATFLPISFAAAANSGSRRPVMKTYAPAKVGSRSTA
jgi:predicted HTH transcriptional regulator